MGFLGDLFDDVVDIASTPAKFVGKVTDDVMETDVEDWVNETTESIKTKKSCTTCRNGELLASGTICTKCGRARR